MNRHNLLALVRALMEDEPALSDTALEQALEQVYREASSIDVAGLMEENAGLRRENARLWEDAAFRATSEDPIPDDNA